jgi:hypothetical protein
MDVGLDPDRLASTFGRLVDASWTWYDDHLFAHHADQVFLGGLVTIVLDAGYVLIDLLREDQDHWLRFEEVATGARLAVHLTHLTPTLEMEKTFGQRAAVTFGYGERQERFAAVMKVLGGEIASKAVDDLAPGTFRLEADVTEKYVYAEVPLFLELDRYVQRDWTVQQDALREDVAAVVATLRDWLRRKVEPA